MQVNLSCMLHVLNDLKTSPFACMQGHTILGIIERLLSENPADRPTAEQLYAEPFFTKHVPDGEEAKTEREEETLQLRSVCRHLSRPKSLCSGANVCLRCPHGVGGGQRYFVKQLNVELTFGGTWVGAAISQANQGIPSSLHADRPRTLPHGNRMNGGGILKLPRPSDDSGIEPSLVTTKPAATEDKSSCCHPANTSCMEDHAEAAETVPELEEATPAVEEPADSSTCDMSPLETGNSAAASPGPGAVVVEDHTPAEVEEESQQESVTAADAEGPGNLEDDAPAEVGEESQQESVTAADAEGPGDLEDSLQVSTSPWESS